MSISVTKTPTTSTVAPGGTVTYLINITNGTGVVTASPTTFTDNFPSGTTFVSLTPFSGSTTPTSISGNTLGGSGPLTITFATGIPSGGSYVASLVLAVPSSAIPGTSLANVGTLISDDTTILATSPLVVVGDAASGLTVVKTGPKEVCAGRRAEYLIAVTNSGPSPASNVVLVDKVTTCPHEKIKVKLQQLTNPGSPFSIVRRSNCVTATISTLPVGTTIFVAIVRAPKTACALINTATITTTTLASNPSNNISTVATCVKSKKKREVEKSLV